MVPVGPAKTAVRRVVQVIGVPSVDRYKLHSLIIDEHCRKQPSYSDLNDYPVATEKKNVTFLFLVPSAHDSAANSLAQGCTKHGPWAACGPWQP